MPPVPGTPSPPPPPPARSHRLAIPITILAVAALGLAALQRWEDLDRNLRLVFTLLGGVLTALLLLAWFLFLSRFPWKTRLGTLALLALTLAGLRLALRVDGTTDGRGLPRLAWKWSPPPNPEPPPSTPPPSPAAPSAPTAQAAATAPSAPPLPAGLADAPQFFGPQRDGVVRGPRLARDWTATPPRERWRQPIGAGWSAFAVVAGRAFTQEQRGEEEWTSGYDVVSGALVWTHRRTTRFEQWQAGAGPHATPTVAGGRVFAYGARGHLDCLDAQTGHPVWSRSVLEDHRLSNLEWGVSASPLVYDDLVVVTGAEPGGPTVIAYDRATGEPRWHSGTDRASYASPLLATLAGRPVVLSFNAATLTAHDPARGTVLLEHRWGMDKPPKGAQPVVIAPDRVFLSAGYGMGCELFRVTATPSGPDPASAPPALALTSLWKNARLKAQFNSVAVRDGYFYGLDDGFLACVEVESGRRLWKDGRYGSGQSLLVEDLVIVQAENGDVALAEARPEAFRELGRLRALSSKTWNHPTVAGNFLLVRNDREAVAYELPLAPPATAAP